MRALRNAGAGLVLGLGISLGAALPAAAADPAAGDAELRERVEKLEQELAVQKRKREIQEEQDAARAKEAPVVGAGKDGFFLRSADGKSYQIRFRGYTQADGRFLLEGNQGNDDSFAFRRVRPLLEGTLLDKIDFRLMPDFAGGNFQLFDVYANLRYVPQAMLQVGKFKPPVGLERLQSATAISFAERGTPTFLVPSRDIGVQVWSDLWGGLLSYQVGVFNGVPDNAISPDLDTNDGKDVAVRLFAHPFQEGPWELLRGLGTGVAVTVGQQDDQTPPSFRNAWANASFFSLRAAAGGLPAVAADGERFRISPQGYYYYGPFGLLWEYVHNNERFTRGFSSVHAAMEAWQLAASWVVTGENASYKGVVPRSNFAIDGSGFGAFEVAARFGQIEFDNDLFPFFSDPSVSAQKETQWTLGVNWYLNKFAKLVLNFDHVGYQGGAAAGGNRDDEGVLITRLQLAW